MNPIDLSVLGPRIEKAQADQNRAVALAAAQAHPDRGIRTLPVAGGHAHFLGAGHVLNQALGLGLDGPVTPSDLDAVEALLGQDGAPVTLELTPFADPSLPRLLGQRGYRVHQFQQVYLRGLEDPDLGPVPGLEVRPVRPGEEALFSQVVMAGFMERDDLVPEAAPMMPLVEVPGTTRYLAWLSGEPAAGGTLGLHDGVATLSGTATLPRFRGRGVQAALVRARLAAGREAGCRWASTATLPGSASARNMLRLGFQVLYPKLEMIREG